jgi:uncharacterized protein with NRDE domain
MCTVSWLSSQDGYQLFCNRDERHTRRAAAPPRQHERAGVNFLAPVDGDHGGAWIGVNEFGLSLCLLNRYQDRWQITDRQISRGLLLVELMDSDSQAQTRWRLTEFDLPRYQPFTLVALERGASALLFQWTGQRLTIESNGDAQMPLVSSSYDSAGAARFRREYFAELKKAADRVSDDLLLAFHQSHAPERGPYSVCMHRADAATVSFSRIRAGAKTIEFDYYSAAPCALGTHASRSLRLRNER